MSTYLWVNLGTLLIPLLFSFSRWFPFHKEWKFFFPACLAMAMPFLAWDVWFTDQGIWGFNPDHLVGVYLLGLPFEEYLFFLCIPYACVFTYYALRQHCTAVHLHAHLLLKTLAAALIVSLIFVHDRLYSFVTFLCLGLCLAFLTYRRLKYLDHFLAMYLVTLVPFFVVNGILTGSWIHEEVVWYNNQENLGIRLGSIPLEDTLYSMLMLLMTVSIMEGLKQLSKSRRAL